MPDDDFLKYVNDIGGTEPEIFQIPEFLDYILPILRNDLKLAKNYCYVKRNKTKCNITVYWGSEEDVAKDALEGWREHSEGSASFKCYPGGHFFINENMKALVKDIATTLSYY